MSDGCDGKLLGDPCDVSRRDEAEAGVGLVQLHWAQVRRQLHGDSNGGRVSPRVHVPVKIFSAFVALGILAACSSETIVLAELYECAQNVECPMGWRCEKKACGDATGVCTELPAECSAQESLVCGCDGVTYLNDCVRSVCGSSSSMPGACPKFSGVPAQKASCIDPVRTNR
jgi:hypothetical protein